MGTKDRHGLFAIVRATVPDDPNLVVFKSLTQNGFQVSLNVPLLS